ncbi:MAG: M4 family metallopeptidase [Tannerella sp.]|jgi:hypothetical protein|nr:M4 family metallopeptidase [Tannerella sp.]
MGACVENWAYPAKPIWLAGSEIVRSPNSCLRNMQTPKVNNHPTKYQGQYWDFSNSSQHANSTVLSHWFYLLCAGGNGNNEGILFNVPALGFNRAERIIYRTLQILYSSSNFSAARNASIQAAQYLFGSMSFEVIAVTNAWHAVGIGNRHLPVITSITGPTNTPNGQYATYWANTHPQLPYPTSYQWILNPQLNNNLYGTSSAVLDIAFYTAGDYQLVCRAFNQNDGGWGDYHVINVRVY